MPVRQAGWAGRSSHAPSYPPRSPCLLPPGAPVRRITPSRSATIRFRSGTGRFGPVGQVRRSGRLDATIGTVPGRFRDAGDEHVRAGSVPSSEPTGPGAGRLGGKVGWVGRVTSPRRGRPRHLAALAVVLTMLLGIAGLGQRGAAQEETTRGRGPLSQRPGDRPGARLLRRRRRIRLARARDRPSAGGTKPAPPPPSPTRSSSSAPARPSSATTSPSAAPASSRARPTTSPPMTRTPATPTATIPPASG